MFYSERDDTVKVGFNLLSSKCPCLVYYGRDKDTEAKLLHWQVQIQWLWCGYHVDRVLPSTGCPVVISLELEADWANMCRVWGVSGDSCDRVETSQSTKLRTLGDADV